MPKKKSIMKKLKEREEATRVTAVETAKSTNDQPLPLP